MSRINKKKTVTRTATAADTNAAARATTASTYSTVQLDCFPVCLQWAPSAAFVAIGGDDGDVRFVDQQGTIAARFAAHPGGVTALAWHPLTGELATTGQDRKVMIWTQGASGDAWSSREVYTAERNQIEKLAWSSTHRWLALAEGKQVLVAMAASVTELGEPLVVHALGELPSSVTGLQFSPSGSTLGAAAFGGVSLFDPVGRRVVKKLEWKGSMLGLEFSPDGTVVACGCQDNSVHFWRIASGKDAQMSGYPTKPTCVSFSSNGTYLATNGDASICLWPFDARGPEGRSPVVLEGHGSAVTELAFAPMVDLLLSGDRDGTLALWTPPALKTPAMMHRMPSKIAALGWGVDVANQTLCWAAADQNGTLLLGVV